MNIKELLKLSITKNASDLHVSTGMPPMLRMDGQLIQLELPRLENETVLNMILDTMSEKQQKEFALKREYDYAFESETIARVRANAFWQQRGVSAAFRILPKTIFSLDALHAPSIIYQLCEYTQGLVLVTGATGSGKSATLSAMLHHINQTQRKHIITLEDPIEMIHQGQLSLIQQREIKRDTRHFTNALRMALREDPDIILVGEMRDLNTIRLALIAAETGHLVLSTLHTQSAAKTIDRVIQVFPVEEQYFIRTLFSQTLRAVISQRLFPKKGGGRMAAFEVLLNSTSVSHLIRENKTTQIYSVMQMNQQMGMQTMEQGLTEIAESIL